MRPIVLCLALLPLLACPVDYQPPPDKDDTGVEGDADTDADTDTDTDTDLEDLDHDGWTVEEGDCDDENPYVHPGWEEDPDDGVDNDCDGRVDEEWSGVTVGYYNSDGASSILDIDHLGRVEQEVDLVDAEVFPLWLDHGVDGGWVINNSYTTVELVGSDGYSSVLHEFTKKDTEWALYGLCTHPDGYYLASTIDALWRIDADGSVSQLATWSTDMSDPATFDLLPYTVTVDWTTGEVGLVGYYGGFALWSEEGGLDIRRRPDIEDWDGVVTYSGAHKDMGGWYSIKMDAYAGVVTISRFDLSTDEWVDRVTWDEQWSPNVLGIDGDSGDFYVTANGGWYYAVWLVGADDGYATDLYMTDGTVPNRGFWGLTMKY
jgi:hypothetical protein